MTPTFVLTRILGNDLPPRHGGGQTLTNLAFLLANEPEFPGCQKRWVLNRIANPEREAELIALLDAHRQPWVRIPFDAGAYTRRFLDAEGLPPGVNPVAIVANETMKAEFEWIHRHKNLYAINVNGARNAALADARATGARWLLPWDGACFLTARAFAGIAEAAAAAPDALYIIVPMERERDNARLLDPEYRPDNAPEEPQIAFRADAHEIFDERFRYGMMPKAELLRRLGVPGPWQTWFPPEWERGLYATTSVDYGRFEIGGWVARLDAEATDSVEVDGSTRRAARFGGIAGHAAAIETAIVAGALAAGPLICYGALLRATPPGGPAAQSIVAAATAFLAASPVTVTSKPSPPTGIAPNDYVSIRRYAHQNPDGTWGTRDGVSNPAAMPGGEGSEHYDRFRLQAMIDAVTALALATRLTGDRGCAEHAAHFLRVWFIDPATRMNPHRRFAQIVPDRPDERAGAGFVDFRDMFGLVDAIRIVGDTGALTTDERAALAAWFAAFRDDLLSDAAIAVALRNNVGILHDLLLAAVASAAGDARLMAAVIARAPLRFGGQIAPSGEQPEEMRRTRPLHYSLFALQAMIGMATLGRAVGIDLWQWQAEDGRSLATALRYIADNRAGFADYAAGPARFDDRIEMALRAFPHDAAGAANLHGIPRHTVADAGRLGADDGFAPWWPLLLARDPAGTG